MADIEVRIRHGQCGTQLFHPFLYVLIVALEIWKLFVPYSSYIFYLYMRKQLKIGCNTLLRELCNYSGDFSLLPNTLSFMKNYFTACEMKSVSKACRQ